MLVNSILIVNLKLHFYPLKENWVRSLICRARDEQSGEEWSTKVIDACLVVQYSIGWRILMDRPNVLCSQAAGDHVFFFLLRDTSTVTCVEIRSSHFAVKMSKWTANCSHGLSKNIILAQPSPPSPPSPGDENKRCITNLSINSTPWRSLCNHYGVEGLTWSVGIGDDMVT